MSWTWTSQDLAAWRELTELVSCAVDEARQRGRPYRGTIRNLGRSAKRAMKAAYPTNDPGRIEVYRAVLHSAQELATGVAPKAAAAAPRLRTPALTNVRFPYRDD